MYDSNLKYIAISYRWGETEEQLVKTQDYTAHIISFHLTHLIWLCKYINHEPDLKDIPYLWIDAISIDQQNHARKKETILKMNQIYKKASYILAVPDLHKWHLLDNTANKEMINLIKKYRDIIHHDIYNNAHPFKLTSSNIEDLAKHTNIDHHYYYSAIKNLIQKKRINENEELSKEMNEAELKKVYQFLAYLIFDWSNRAWVISEHQIAKQKYKQHGTLLKYIFISLLSTNGSFSSIPFFSYTFANQNHGNSDMNNGQYLHYTVVDNSNKFIRFLELTFTERPYLDMLLRSNASRNEDRFYAILPSWNKYNYLIEHKNTISNWKITDMVSVRLKLYEIMDDADDLWNKARLLLYCSIRVGKPNLPSFATCHNPSLVLAEIDHVSIAHKLSIECISEFKEDAKQYIEDYKKEYGTIFKQNLLNIKYHQQQCFLSVKANTYFLFSIPSLSSMGFSQEDLTDYSLKDTDSLRLIYIPYFIYTIHKLRDLFPFYNASPMLSGILLLGNYDINRWILVKYILCSKFGKPSLISIEDDYIFNIY
ncbi:unnamed protein product [Cunninghamella blakesleeana]